MMQWQFHLPSKCGRLNTMPIRVWGEGRQEGKVGWDRGQKGWGGEKTWRQEDGQGGVGRGAGGGMAGGEARQGGGWEVHRKVKRNERRLAPVGLREAGKDGCPSCARGSLEGVSSMSLVY
mgnify:CR=1 FL=1